MSRHNDLLVNLLVPGIATEEEFLEYAQLYQTEVLNQGGKILSLEEFYRPGDIDNWRAARDWWPKDAPGVLMMPDLGTMARNVGGLGIIDPKPFMEALTSHWERVCLWLQKEKRSLQNPNETPEQRRSRKGREAQARFRERRANDIDPERKQKLESVKQAYDNYLEACRTRAEIKKQQDEIVRKCWETYEQVKAEAK